MSDLDSQQATSTRADNETAGPRRAVSLRSRGAELAPPLEQLRLLDSLPLTHPDGRRVDFDEAVKGAGHPEGLRPGRIEVFQINLGKLCNMTCAHCHVDAGPDRGDAMMDRDTVDACLRAIDTCRGAEGAASDLVIDITGGAPELSPHFRHLVDECAQRGLRIIDRCNLTVLLLPRFEGLPQWLGERGVEIACSLPHHRRPNTDAQRGAGAWDQSMEALALLNAAGYGLGDPRRLLTLVSNPAGAFLAGHQATLEREWKASLGKQGIAFDRLIALNNMPISRFLDWLHGSGNLQPYMERLVGAFNPDTIDGLMCRSTLSVSWDGRIFDCDFNQMLDMESAATSGDASIHDFHPDRLAGRAIATARHCFGCTAGAGSSCGGATTR